jgi:hypothetical protein
MTIAVRSDWMGNDAETTFTDVKDAVAYLEAKNPFFEIVPDTRIRPFGDVEADVPDDCSREEFDRIQTEMLNALSSFFESCDRKYALTTASSYALKRWSCHWHTPEVYVDTLKHAEEFAESLYQRLDFPAPVKGDIGIYTSKRKMRNGSTPKKGIVRPFVIVHGSWADTMIGYIPDGCTRYEFELKPKPVVRSSGVVLVEELELKPLLDCLKLERWTDYTICRNLVWAMRSCGASEETIHHYCSKANNYGFRWVEDLIHSFNPEKSPTFTYIKKYAKLDNPVQYKRIVHANPDDPAPYIEEMTALTIDEHVIYDTGRYLMNLPKHDTLAIKSALGSGKTHAFKKRVKELLKSNSKARILVLSGRCSFSDHIFGELKGLGFIHYAKEKEESFKNKKGKITQLDNPLLILQMSPASLKLISEQSYDLIVGDEIETILTMMSYLSFYHSVADFLLMGKTFERIMRDTQSVIVMDAFLTDRSLEMLRTLRGETLVILNTNQPYNKTLIQYAEKETFFTRLAASLIHDKKRAVSIFSTKVDGSAFAKQIGERVNHVFYHKDSDAKIKEKDMMDVDKEWEKYDSVSYTGTITIGVNYSKGKPFDVLGLCASAWGGTARDTIQALHRARHVKENKIYAYIDDGRGRVCGDPGMSAQEEFWAMSKFMKSKILKDMGEKEEDYGTLPDWWKRVILFNRNEKVINSLFYSQCLTYYLNACGIQTELMAANQGCLKSLRVRLLSH